MKRFLSIIVFILEGLLFTTVATVYMVISFFPAKLLAEFDAAYIAVLSFFITAILLLIGIFLATWFSSVAVFFSNKISKSTGKRFFIWGGLMTAYWIILLIRSFGSHAQAYYSSSTYCSIVMLIVFFTTSLINGFVLKRLGAPIYFKKKAVAKKADIKGLTTEPYSEECIVPNRIVLPQISIDEQDNIPQLATVDNSNSQLSCADVVYCHRCGYKLIDGSTFCSNCGTRVRQ